MGALCAQCGEMIVLPPAGSDANKSGARAPVQMSFLDAADGISVSVEVREHRLRFIWNEPYVPLQYARAMTRAKISSLLMSRKLIMVLDLDNTLIHAMDRPPPPGTGRMIGRPLEYRLVDMLTELSLIEGERTFSSEMSSQFEEEEDDYVEKVALIDAENIQDEMRLPDTHRSGCDFAHYVEDADADDLTLKIVRNIERNVFHLRVPVYRRKCQV